MTDPSAPAAIDIQPWMRTEETARVFAALEAAGGEGCVRFVGGCVRNALMRIPVRDIDLATRLHPDAVCAALERAGLRYAPTGLSHGTVTAICGARTFEITTLRRDVETDGRRAVVAFSDSWEEDAQRRDFRLNALYADREGRLFDPTGAGISDAGAGRIVFVGEPEARIREDALRILRFFRFQAWYGRGAPDPSALAACAALADRVDGLSAERVSKELLTLLAADDPREAVRLMTKAGVLGRILPRLADPARFEALVEIETGILFACEPLLRLAALLPDADAGASTGERLRLSTRERERLVAALGDTPRLVSWMSPRETRRAVYALGAQTFGDRARLAWAGSGRPATGSQWRALLAVAATWTRPVLPLSGAEVTAAGVPAGPLVGAVLREVEAWWIDHDFTDDKLSLIEQLKAVAQGMAY